MLADRPVETDELRDEESIKSGITDVVAGMLWWTAIKRLGSGQSGRIGEKNVSRDLE